MPAPSLRFRDPALRVGDQDRRIAWREVFQPDLLQSLARSEIVGFDARQKARLVHGALEGARVVNDYSDAAGRLKRPASAGDGRKRSSGSASRRSTPVLPKKCLRPRMQEDGPWSRGCGARSGYDVRARCIRGCSERRQGVSRGRIGNETENARFCPGYKRRRLPFSLESSHHPSASSDLPS